MQNNILSALTDKLNKLIDTIVEYCFRRLNLASTKPNSNRDPRAGQVDRDTWQDKQFILCKKCWKCDLGAPKAT